MADEIQGGLAGAERPTVEIPAVASPLATPPSTPISNIKMPDYGQLDVERKNINAQVQNLLQSLEDRTKPTAFDFWSGLSRGFSNPNAKTFSQGLGSAVGELRGQEDARKSQITENALMRLQLGQQQLGMTKQSLEEQKGIALEGAIKSLYGTRKGPFGEDVPVINEDAAKQISVLTRDPTYAANIINGERSRKIQDAVAGAFKSVIDSAGKTSYQFDPSSITKILGAGGSFKEIAEIAKSIPDLKRSGMLGGSSVQGTPFDAIALMAPSPALKSHAERLIQQYKAGAFKDDESAEKQAQTLLTLMTNHMDKQQAMIFNQSMQSMMIGLRQDDAAMKREKFDAQQAANNAKLTDEQKIVFNKVIIPVQKAGVDASSALLQLQGVEDKIAKAPSGWIPGVLANSVGALFGTESNEALRELERLQKSLLAQMPRLPGSQSNFDAQNLEKAIGNLTDVKMTNKQRTSLVKELKLGFEKLADRAYAAQLYWESNRKVLPELLNQTRTIAKTGTVTSGENKGKKIIQYSDGTVEYKE
jgi:hypothetical protein